MPAIQVTNIVELLDEEMKKGNVKATAAFIEWTALTVMVGHMDHVLCHIDPAVVEAAVLAATQCSGPAEGNSTHMH